ncbi:hypothetical protein GCM10007063_18370 [Lentibacillus kapialis]|uniref:Uncharacterized protein n=1 Tax=Lentibacillus kapialis TaxID=340214 RepID=A0A917UYF2_9BACI|nr:hypothetical protein [Lentibacillus kapialis]GGJ96211.1 hypothetical protein GCM10007063_18370 [Lentibacillus kapialis]
MLLNNYYAKSVAEVRMEHLHRLTIGNETFNHTQCIKKGFSMRNWMSHSVKNNSREAD